MSKKVLVISSSPRKGGNSDTLCNQFIMGADEAGNQTEKIFLRDKEINYCIGCGACTKNSGKCVHKDDMADILEKMIIADVIVLATPVYFYSMDAQLKTLIDRCVSRYTEIKDKDFYFIMTAADGVKSAMNRTIEGLRGFTYCLPNANEKGIVYGIGAWGVGDILKTSAMKEAYEMGKGV